MGNPNQFDWGGEDLIVKSIVFSDTPGGTQTALSSGEVSVLDGVTAGTAAASKALVLNSSSAITTGFSALTVTTVTPTTIAGAANFSGAPTFASSVTIAGADIWTPDIISAAGAVSVVTPSTRISSAGAIALTLANGTNGQLKTIVMGTDGGDATLTPATKTGYSTIVFNDVGDGCILQYYTTIGWIVLGSFGPTIS